MEDAELMAQVQAGRLDRMADLFERHVGPLLGFFFRLTARRGYSEDLVQEVFCRMLQYRKSFRVGSAFAPWMYQIARNVHRRQAKSVPVSEDEALLEVLPDASESAHARLEREHRESLLREALRRLEPRKRELLLLSRQPDLSYQQIAELTGSSVGAVKVQVHRALKELRTIYLALEGGAA